MRGWEIERFEAWFGFGEVFERKLDAMCCGDGVSCVRAERIRCGVVIIRTNPNV